MVYLILTRKGYTDLQQVFTEPQNSFWISGNILSKEEAENHWLKKVNLTILNDQINVENTRGIQEALLEIAEHHPGETIWLEKRNTL